MVIHSYLTNGFYEWAKVFIQSFRLHNGSDMRIVLSTRDLKERQIKELYSLVDNIEIRNESLDLEKMSRSSGFTIERLVVLKKQIEEIHVTPESVIWKQFISVEDRYRNSIIDVMCDYKNEDFLIHFDIDTYIIAPLDKLFNLVRSNDISIRFRPNSYISRKVLGNLIGFRLGGKCDEFMDRWVHHIDAKPIKAKPAGYGQTSFYYAYLDTKDTYSWGDIPLELFNGVVWTREPSARGKSQNLKSCRKDFRSVCEKLQRKK